MTRWWNSLRFRLCLLVFLGLAPALILAFHNYSEHLELTRALAQEKAFLTAGQVQLGMENIAETTRQLLTSLAKDPAVTNLDLLACKQIIEDCYGKRPFLFYSNIGMADTQGNVLCSAVPFSGEISLSDRHYFLQALATREFSIGGFQRGRMTGKTVVSFGYPIIDGSGAVRGVLFAGVDLSWFNRLVEAADLPPGTTLTVIDHEGTVLSRNLEPEKWVGKSAPEAGIVRACLTQQQGTIDAVGINGIRKAYGFRSFGQLPQAIHVYVGVPEETLLAKSRDLFFRHLIWLGIALGLGLATVWVFAYVFVMRTTGRVIEAARKLGQGDLRARTGLNSRDGEIGELGLTFDRMAENLGEHMRQRAEAEGQLRKEKELSDTVLSSLPGVFYLFDGEGKFRRWNTAFEELSGRSAQEIARMNPLQFIAPRDRGTIEKAIEQVFTTGEVTVEANWLTRTGNEIPYYFTGKKIDIDGAEHLVGMGVDIGARKRAEEDRMKSEQMLKDILDASPVGISLSDNRVIRWANKSWEQMFGFERAQDYEGRSARILYDSDEEYDRAGRALYGNLQQGVAAETDATMRRMDGTLFHAHFRMSLASSSDTAGPSIVTAISDISERKRAEASLHLRDSALTYSISGISMLDLDGNLTYVNAAALRLWGYDDEKEVLKRPGLEFWTQEKEAGDAFRIAVRTGSWIGELMARRNDGSPLDLHAAITLVRDPAGKPVAVMGSYLDISERKRAEEALRQSEAKYRLLVENANELICVVQDGMFVFANSRAISESGYSLEELISMSFLDVVHPEDRNVPLMLYQGAMSGQERSDACVFRVIDKRGRPRWAHVSVVRVEWNDRPAAMVLGIDITAQKEAEEELRRREQTLQGILAACPVGIDMASPDRKLLWANESWMRMFGFESEEEYVGKNTSMVYVSQDDYERVGKEWSKQLREQEVAECESKFRRKNGTVFDAHVWVTAVDKADPTKGAIAVVMDVSDRIEAERSLREALEQVRRSNRESQALLQGTSALLEYQLFDDAAKHLFGSCKELIGATAGYVGLVSKDGTEFELVHLDTGGIPCSVDPSFRVPVRGLRAEVCREARGLYENDFPNTEWMRFMPAGHARLDNVLYAPLILDGKPVGLVGLANKDGGFDDHDVQLAQAFAGFAALGLLKSRTLESSKHSEERLERLIQSSPIGIGIVQAGKYAYANPALINMTGCSSPDEIVGESALTFVVPEDRDLVLRRGRQRLEGTEAVSNYQVRGLRRNGERFDVTIWPTRIEYEGQPALLSFIVDFTEETRLKAQLLQAQKMEAIGTLAGGIAHDFNNLLTVVNGYSELLLVDKSPDDPDYDDLAKIRTAGIRGADLVQGLLAFSRKAESKPRPLDLNRQVETVKKLIGRTIPKMIAIEVQLADDLETVHADPTQIEQILMNLTVNARDAMPDGGRLTIETQNVILDDEYCRTHPESVPGAHVMLSVSDTGHGMDQETLGHIFEPFYTTKERGKGTGLGLAMVFGIVKQHEGHITCHSEPGRGTTFRIYFPIGAIEPAVKGVGQTSTPPGGMETILLVDDEDLIRDLGTKMLERFGYTVITATNGRDALEIYVREINKISLVILDVMMPEMGGKECFVKLVQMNPNVKVVMASGYTSGSTTKVAEELGAKGFVSKPFDMRRLLEAVREVLDSD